MNPHQPLIDQLYREQILRARKQSPEARFRGCMEITELAFQIMRAGVRHQFPEADPAELVSRGRERIAKGRRMDELQRYIKAQV
jgi:hypothetical protein